MPLSPMLFLLPFGRYAFQRGYASVLSALRYVITPLRFALSFEAACLLSSPQDGVVMRQLFRRRHAIRRQAR